MSLLRPFFALLFLTISPAAKAVMPPMYEARAALDRFETADQQRNQAPEVVVVKVREELLQVPHTMGCPSKMPWTMEGEVIKVIRGTVKPGTVIRVQTVWERYECPGPIREPIPMLKKGDETEAFLVCSSENQCRPAADAMSFISTEEFKKEINRRKDEVR